MPGDARNFRPNHPPPLPVPSSSSWFLLELELDEEAISTYPGDFHLPGAAFSVTTTRRACRFWFKKYAFLSAAKLYRMEEVLHYTSRSTTDYYQTTVPMMGTGVRKLVSLPLLRYTAVWLM